MKTTRFITACLALTLVFGTVAFAQVSGTIKGVIQDDDGAALPGVSINVTNEATGVSRTTVTNSEGAYSSPALPSGDYSVTASLEGMQTVRREGISVLVGQTVDINFKLGVETVTEAITVTSVSPIIETSRSATATYVSEVEVQSLPTAGRDFTDFALLTPTVQQDTVRGFLVMSGQRGIYSGLNIDGTDSKSAFFGYGAGGEATENSGLVVAQDSVKEFQVITSAFAPEYGANGGGYINVVTKSGGNQTKGTAFYLFQDDGMSEDLEATPLDKFNGRGQDIVPSAFDRQNLGVSVGGPIVKNRTHYFVTVDKSDRESPTVQTIRTPGLYDEILASPIPGVPTLVDNYVRNADGTATGNFTRDVDNLIIFGKIDQQIGDSATLSGRVNFTDFERISSYADEESQKLEDTTSLVLSLVNVIGTDKVNEARIQRSEDNLDRLSSRVGGPQEAQIRFRFGNFDSVGKFDFLPIFVEEAKLQFQNNFSYLFGNHDLKFGIDYQKDDLKQLFAGSLDGRYDFRSLADFQNNNASAVRIYFGDVTFPNYDEAQEILGIYAQDTYRPNGRLTFNYGIRYGATYNPDGLVHILPEGRDIADDTDNIEPRVGFTYALDDEGTSVIRGGFGIFHGRTPSLLFASQVQENGLFPNFGRITVSPGQTGFVPLGTPIDNENPPAGTIPSTGYVDPTFEDAEFMRLNFGYERELGGTWSAGVDVIYAEGDNLQTNVDINRSFTLDANGRPFYSSTRPNPNFNAQLTRQSIGESEYKAVTLKVNRRFAGRFQFQAHYTWSEDEDTDSNERSATGHTIGVGGNDRSQWDPMYDWGPSERDVENRLVASGIVLLPWDFKVSGIFEYRSGRPFNPTDTSADFAACGFFTLGFDCLDARPVVNGGVLGRNSFTNDSIQNIDLRISKFFSFGDRYELDVFFEVFNLLDDQAFEVNDSFSGDNERDPTSPTFGLEANRVTLPRIYQIGLRFGF